MPTSSETTAYLSLGSNLGDRQAILDAALDRLDRLPVTELQRRSALYESKPWGKTDQPDFLNMVVEIVTQLEPHALLRHLKAIERELGRAENAERWSARPIDIDILLFGGRALRTATLQVPHPYMWERRFVLEPLLELLPDLEAPDGTPAAALLQKPELSSQGLLPYAGRQEGDAAPQ